MALNTFTYATRWEMHLTGCLRNLTQSDAILYLLLLSPGRAAARMDEAAGGGHLAPARQSLPLPVRALDPRGRQLGRSGASFPGRPPPGTGLSGTVRPELEWGVVEPGPPGQCQIGRGRIGARASPAAHRPGRRRVGRGCLGAREPPAPPRARRLQARIDGHMSLTSFDPSESTGISGIEGYMQRLARMTLINRRLS